MEKGERSIKLYDSLNNRLTARVVKGTKALTFLFSIAIKSQM